MILVGDNYNRGPMMMDIELHKIKDHEEIEFFDDESETAFLLLDGKAIFSWENHGKHAKRKSLFDECPSVLHISKGVKVKIKSAGISEILVQKTVNPKMFAPVFYSPEDIYGAVLGGDSMNMCAKRIIRDIFNFSNAPYSNMVMGEVITLPGKWSSYPPHWHHQPEVYFHRFDKPQGFGISVIGDNANIVQNNSVSIIPGGLTHPQVSAPGYAMYYCWMIRHLENNPWTERIDDPDHSWLHDRGAAIWNENELFQRENN
jgi:5-deoxy-glucuronate isomerase